MKQLITLALLFSPVVVWGASLPPAPQGTSASSQIVQKIDSALPAWEADSLAQYEQLEIAAVRLDVLACELAATTDDFFIYFEQLRRDIGTLVALDISLDRRLVI